MRAQPRILNASRASLREFLPETLRALPGAGRRRATALGLLCWLALGLGLVPARTVAAGASRLVILVPAGPHAPGPVTVGIVALDEAGRAVPPAAGVSLGSAGAAVTRGAVSGPVTSFRLTLPAKSGPVPLSATAPGLPEVTGTIDVGSAATGQIEVVADPASPVKGRDSEARLSITVRGPDGAPDPSARPPVVEVNVGKVVELRKAGPGRFTARYLLPERRWPEVAIVAAFAPWPHDASPHGAFGRALLPLASSIELPGRTPRPNVAVTVEIAGKAFGPVQADGTGAFRVPVIVPPGHRFGTGVTVDRLGTKKRTVIDLQLPEISRIACVASPPRLPADGVSQARVICAATDPFGAPLKAAALSLTAPAGKATPLTPHGQGTWEALFTAPASGAGQVVLAATFPAAGQRSREEIPIALAHGPPARAELSSSRVPLPIAQPGELAITVWDAAGVGVAGGRIALTASAGVPGPVEELAPGRYRSSLIVATEPADGSFRVELRARVAGPPGSVPAELLLAREGGEVVAHVRDAAGWPVEGVRLGGGGVTGADGSWRQARPPPGPGAGKLELSLAELPAVKGTLFEGVTVAGTAWGWPPAPAPAVLALRRDVPLMPAAPVDVRVEVAGDEVRWQVLGADGSPLPDRPVEVLVTGAELEGRVRTAEGGKARLARRSGVATITVRDVESGVGATRRVAAP